MMPHGGTYIQPFQLMVVAVPRRVFIGWNIEATRTKPSEEAISDVWMNAIVINEANPPIQTPDIKKGLPQKAWRPVVIIVRFHYLMMNSSFVA